LEMQDLIRRKGKVTWRYQGRMKKKKRGLLSGGSFNRGRVEIRLYFIKKISGCKKELKHYVQMGHFAISQRLEV